MHCDLPTAAEPSRRGRCARRALSLCTALAAGAFAGRPAAAVPIGPGLVSSAGADTGDRLNVDGVAPQTLAAGTYDVTNFTYNATGTGEVVPFLATASGDNEYQLLWIGSALLGTSGATASGDPVGNFTLATASQVHAGFYTAAEGRVAFSTGGNTDHNGTVVVPRGGVAIGPFTNPDLGRTYAFSVSADPSSQTHVGPGFLSNSGADNAGGRLNVDQAHARTFAPGVYNVTDFSFNGTLVPNETNPGNVTPFLARLTGDNTYETVWVGAGVPSATGGVSVDPAGGFTLDATETLYAGFATTGNAAVAFTEGPGRPPGFGITDHDNSFTVPVGAGETIGGFSNADLARQYSFSVGATLIPEPGTAALAMVGGLLLLRRRAGRRG